MAAMPGTTAWPEAMPEVEDLPHSVDCSDCQSSGESYLDIECGCGHVGDAPIVDLTYTLVHAHCPVCGASHCEPREPDWKDFQ